MFSDTLAVLSIFMRDRQSHVILSATNMVHENVELKSWVQKVNDEGVVFDLEMC